jgi:hypothetical protein
MLLKEAHSSMKQINTKSNEISSKVKLADQTSGIKTALEQYDCMHTSVQKGQILSLYHVSSTIYHLYLLSTTLPSSLTISNIIVYNIEL